MKVLIDNKPEEFVKIFITGDHWQCNTTGHKTAHSFNIHPKHLPKDKEIKTNGHVYIFPSKYINLVCVVSGAGNVVKAFYSPHFLKDIY